MIIDGFDCGTDNCGSLGGASYNKHLVLHAQLPEECGRKSLAIAPSRNSGKYVGASG